MQKWEFRCVKDVQKFWCDICSSVPGRTEGRENYQEDRYHFGLYLLALATHKLLPYPLLAEQGESPDFMLTRGSNETTGLEVTRATEEWFERTMTEGEKEFRHRDEKAKGAGAEIIPLPAQQGVLVMPREEAEPVSILLSQEGWIGDKAEIVLCCLFCIAIGKKLPMLPKYREASCYDLLIYDETPLPATNHQKVFEIMNMVARILKKETPKKRPKLGKISIIISRDVAFDLGGEFRFFPYTTE